MALIKYRAKVSIWGDDVEESLGMAKGEPTP
jgi:hypothetical protein